MGHRVRRALVIGDRTMSQADDRQEIRRLVENWALWRDAAPWARFATVRHPLDARMGATWFEGSAADFIEAGRDGLDNGVSILHFLGGHGADTADDRAVINQNAEGAGRLAGAKR
jgi:hypothetical protein